MATKPSKIVILVLCSLLIALSSCRPKGILHSGEMREVMVDLHKTDAMIQLSGLRISESEIKAIYYAEVLERHGITQAQFDSSLVWYTAHPQFFNKIYPKVLKELEAQEADFLAQYGEQLEASKQQRKDERLGRQKEQRFTAQQLDSVFWVMQHGPSTTWYPAPLMHDTIDQFFPQIGVLGGGVVDSLQTGVGVSEVSDN